MADLVRVYNTTNGGSRKLQSWRENTGSFSQIYLLSAYCVNGAMLGA